MSEGMLYLKSSTLWTPAQITTAAWYDASDTASIASSGGLVSQWDDKSGGLHLTQSNDTYKPSTGSRTLNNLNVLDFADNQVIGNAAASLSSASLSVFSVIQLDDIVSISDRVLALVNSTEVNGLINRTPTSIGYRNPEIESVSITPTTDPEIMSYVKSGTASQKAWLDGTELTENTNTVTTFTIEYINAGSQRKTEPPWVPIDGAIAEIIVCTSALSDADRQKVEGYLAWKWSLVDSLPLSHPYKLSPPRI